MCCRAFVLLCRLYRLPSSRHVTFGPLTHRRSRSISITDSLLQTSLLQRLTSRFALSSTSTPRPPSAKSRHAARSSPWINAVADDLRAAKRDRRRAERRRRATGLSVHNDLHNAAKRLVTKFVLRAKVVYLSTKRVQCSCSSTLC